MKFFIRHDLRSDMFWRFEVYKLKKGEFELIAIYSYYINPKDNKVLVPKNRIISVDEPYKPVWIPIIRNFDNKTIQEIIDYVDTVFLIMEDIEIVYI